MLLCIYTILFWALCVQLNAFLKAVWWDYLKSFKRDGNPFYFFFFFVKDPGGLYFSLIYRNNRSFFDWRKYIAVGLLPVFSQNNLKIGLLNEKKCLQRSANVNSVKDKRFSAVILVDLSCVCQSEILSRLLVGECCINKKVKQIGVDSHWSLIYIWVFRTQSTHYVLSLFFFPYIGIINVGIGY